METREYKRKLKRVKAKILEAVLEDFKGCWSKDDVCALGYAVKYIQGLTINDDETIHYETGTELNNNAKWVAVHTLDRILQEYNAKLRDELVKK